MTRVGLLIVAALATLGGCVEPNSAVCEDGTVCPSGSPAGCSSLKQFQSEGSGMV